MGVVSCVNSDPASPGVILAFGVSSTKSVKALARQKNVTIHSHTVIYKLLELLKVLGDLDMCQLLPLSLAPQEHVKGTLPWREEEEVVGEAVVLRTFTLTGARAASVGGCRVKSGRLLRSATFRLLRDGEVCSRPLGKEHFGNQVSFI